MGAVGLRSIVPNSMTLDGMGFDPVPIRTAFLVAKEHNLESLFLPEGYDPDADEGSPSLRSLFRFRFAVGTARDKVEARVAAAKAIDAKWEEFFEDVLIPLLTTSDLVKSFKDDMNVWFDGTNFRDFEVRMAVVRDVPLAIGSAVFILVYMLIHTRSLLLAVVGPVLAMLSVPIAFIICGALLGNTTVNFANFLAVFLAIGFGADVMFVYFDAWTQSEEHGIKAIENRLAWTYRRAVKASLATTSTTALSFLCNMASVIRALRQFGFFMGICVLITWLSLTFIYVPCIVVDHIWCRKIRLSTHSEYTGRKSACFGSWAMVLYRLRYCVLLLTFVGMIIFLALALPALQVSTGMPDIFPANHNQNEGVQVLNQFEGMTQAFATTREEPRREVNVCQESDFESTTCVMQWCEANFATPKPLWEGNGTCNCQRRLRSDCDSATMAPVKIRFIGPSQLSDTQLAVHVANHVLSWPDLGNADLSANARESLVASQRELPQLLQQVWETGDTSLSDVMQISFDLTRQDENAICGWDELCFCSGDLQCKLGWTSSKDLDLPTARRAQEMFTKFIDIHDS